MGKEASRELEKKNPSGDRKSHESGRERTTEWGRVEKEREEQERNAVIVGGNYSD